MPDDILARLAGAGRSSQQASDAALLRASSELFVTRSDHTHDEIRRYEELALHLLSRVPPGDRGFVAAALASTPDAPVAVIQVLARDRIEIAGPVLERSPLLGSLELLGVIAATGPAHQRVIAARPNLPRDVIQALRIAGDQSVAALLEAEPGVTPPTSPAERGRANASVAAARRDPWSFLALERPRRLRVMAEIASSPPTARPNSGGPDQAFKSILSAARVVGHARAGERQALIETIAAGTGIDPEFVAASLADATGEPLAILLKALALDIIQAPRVFLLATETIARDPAAFFALCDLYAGMESSVPEALVASWREPLSRQTRHEPVFVERDADRRSVAERPRQPAPRADRRAEG